MEENVHLEHIEYHFRVYWGYIDWIISKLYLNKLIVFAYKKNAINSARFLHEMEVLCIFGSY